MTKSVNQLQIVSHVFSNLKRISFNYSCFHGGSTIDRTTFVNKYKVFESTQTFLEIITDMIFRQKDTKHFFPISSVIICISEPEIKVPCQL